MKRRDTWMTRAPSTNRREMVTLKALAQGTQSLTSEERKILDERPTARRRGVQVEDQHARILAARAYRHWWAPGFTRIEHRTSNWREAEERMVQGARTGMPDFWLFVPPFGDPDEPDVMREWDSRGKIAAVKLVRARQRLPLVQAVKLIEAWDSNPGARTTPCVRAVCELKSPAHAPKRKDVGRTWWLEDWPEGQETWHALRRDQWQWLRLLDGCGFATCVAYGADQAETFFVGVAGPRPSVMPEGW